MSLNEVGVRVVETPRAWLPPPPHPRDGVDAWRLDAILAWAKDTPPLSLAPMGILETLRLNGIIPPDGEGGGGIDKSKVPSICVAVGEAVSDTSALKIKEECKAARVAKFDFDPAEVGGGEDILVVVGADVAGGGGVCDFLRDWFSTPHGLKTAVAFPFIPQGGAIQPRDAGDEVKVSARDKYLTAPLPRARTLTPPPCSAALVPLLARVCPPQRPLKGLN
jgi:hypothetical protein